MQDFNEVVKGELEKRNMTMTELAKAVGTSPQYISSLLKSDKRWNDTYRKKVSDALGICIEYKVS